jgi:hypothetical protein
MGLDIRSKREWNNAFDNPMLFDVVSFGDCRIAILLLLVERSLISWHIPWLTF